MTKVDYEPKKVELLYKEGDIKCPEISIHSIDGKSFSIKSFKSSVDGIMAEIDGAATDTKFVIQPKVDIEKMKKGVNGRFDIGLTHPECSTITIPFSILPTYKVTPPFIVLFNAEPQKPIKKDLSVVNNYNEDFEVESVFSKTEITKVLELQKKGNRYDLKLEITPPAQQDQKSFFSDEFYINMNDGEKVKIDCRGFYVRPKAAESAEK